MNQHGMKEAEPSRSSDAPQLSVVVASAHSIFVLERFLTALIKQARGGRVEVIVADCGQDDSRQNLMMKYPEVIFILFPEKTPLPTLLGAGIARSTGQIIAITDSTCVVDDRWVSSMLAAHEASDPVIGGAVEVAGCKRMVDWAAYFCEYGQFMHPLKEGAVNELPGNNVSFKHWALGNGQDFAQNGFWKTYWCRKLQEEGVQLVSAPSIIVHYTKTYRLIPFLIRRFHHGRCFAGMRILRESGLRRASYVLASPLLPFLFLARTISAIVSKRRHLKRFILSLPVSILAIMVWSAGELCGYLTGTGKSCAYTR